MALWFWAGLATGRREPWDDELYWTVVYPVAIAVSGAMGYAFPRRPWRWALTLFLAQFLAMTMRAGELGNLWPLGLMVLVVLSLPGMALGKFAAWLRGRRSSE